MVNKIVFSHKDKLNEERSFWLTPVEDLPVIPEHAHDSFEITYVFKGEGYQLVDGKKDFFKAPAFLFSPPGIPHSLASKNGHTIRRISIALYLERFKIFDTLWIVKRTIKKIIEMQVFTLELEDYKDQISKTINELIKEFKNEKKFFNELLATNLNILFIYINRILTSETSTKFSKFSKFEKLDPMIFNVLKNIENKFYHYNSVTDLLQNINIDAKHFSEIFKRTTGFSPIQYLNRVKIEKIAFEIIYKQVNISKIVIENGINDLKNFNKLFKRYIGISPTNFKEKIKIGQYDLSTIDRFHFK